MATHAPYTLPLLLEPLPPVSLVSPLNLRQFASELQFHPDRSKVDYVLSGIAHGFDIGFRPNFQLSSARKNKASTIVHPEVVDAYLQNEVALGRVAGPFESTPLPTLHVSSFGVIPKTGQPGKWRLILDLSSPHGLSVNDGIDPDQFSLQYIKFDDVVTMVTKLGRGALMAKFDVQSAYRNVAVLPRQRHLLGMKWRGKFYIDLALPFGLRSAPFIFNSIADLVEWILHTNYAVSDLKHYLDDYITAGPPHLPQCARNLAIASSVCKRLGLPLHPDKTEGPTTCLIVLGIELDSILQIARLPTVKLAALKQLLLEWQQKKWCTRTQLESLVGKLHHACHVVWPGRTFVRCMINLMCGFRNPDHPIRLNAACRLDLQWWIDFVEEWNGTKFFLLPGLMPLADLWVTSDAAGSIGYGAVYHQQWFNHVWLPAQRPLSIAYKEFFPVVVAAHLWGVRWANRRVCFQLDNASVVYILNSRTSRENHIMALLRSLLGVAARCNFTFEARHIPGVANPIADALSRFNWQVFRQLAPECSPVPTPIPHALLHELVPRT